MLRLIHQSHLRIVKSKQRAWEVLYWPGMSAEIDESVKNCSKCADFQNKQPRQPLQSTETEVWGSGFRSIWVWGQTVHHFSRLLLIEVEELKDMRSGNTIKVLKAKFSRHGIPTTLRTDNGPQYSSEEFKDFCQSYSILHKTSSPHTLHSNGEAERAVPTVKKLWSKAPDKHQALLNYRTTPLEWYTVQWFCHQPSSSNKLPAARALLAPTAYDPVHVKRLLDRSKDIKKYHYDLKRAGKPRPALLPGNKIRMQLYPGNTRWSPGVVVRPHSAPRSYIVESRNKEYCHNSQHLQSSMPAANQSRHGVQQEPWTEQQDPSTEKE